MQIQKQKRNVCVYLFKKAKKDYENTDISNSTDSKKFWKTLKPIFASKVKAEYSIILAVATKIIQEGGELVKTFNTFFITIVQNIGINENLLPTSSSEIRNVESYHSQV